MSDWRADLSALPCPYCWADEKSVCHDECPQYPISIDEDIVTADARTLGRAADDLPILRCGRKRPKGVAQSSEAYDI